MMKAVWSGVAAVALVLGASTSAFAQATANGAIGVTANVAAKAKLTLGTAAIAFADADPDTTPVMTATAVDIDVKARTSGAVTLTVLATGDLVSGSNTIGISNLTWAATGSGYQAGTSNKTVAQTVGAWAGSGSPIGTQTYSLPNSWTYATGTYTVTLNYTLTAP